MFETVKDCIKQILRKAKIRQGFKYDCKNYIKYNYNNPSIKSKNALEAKILRQTHVIEKGMSLSNPRAKFGVEKAKTLLLYIDEFVEYGFSIQNSTAVRNSIGVLFSYVDFHRKRGFVPEEIVSQLNKYEKYLSGDVEGFGIIETDLESITKQAHSEFPDFFSSRHSVRQFSDKSVDVEDIKKSVALAMRAPSACNRQSYKAYFYKAEDTNKKLGELIAGNTGFDDEVKNYIVVTGDISAFYDSFERNQMYVDGGIFALALVQALHYNGIASCILQNGEFIERDKQFREICGNIPDNEKIILFIAVGYYKDKFAYAASHRKALDEMLIIAD